MVSALGTPCQLECNIARIHANLVADGVCGRLARVERIWLTGMSSTFPKLARERVPSPHCRPQSRA